MNRQNHYNRNEQRAPPRQKTSEELLVQAKQIDSFSSALINVGVTIVKKHPIPVS